MRRGGALAVVVAAVVAGACGQAGLVHHVRPGETLYRIGKAYGVSHLELARVNGIDDPDRIEIGQPIRIPGAERTVPVTVVTPRLARAERPDPSELRAGRGAFAWPVDGARLESPFGPRGASHHDGIDLGAPEGTPVRAARGGRVLYSAGLRGYGNVIILEHGDGWASVYAHNRENRALLGGVVQQGEVIAALGSTGKTTGPNLHFEIRKDNVARNPLFFLPDDGGVRDALTRRAGDPES